MSNPILRGLYAITPNELCADPARLLAAAESALRGGARLIQYRDKTQEVSRRESSCIALLALCRKHRAKLIVNDDVELAAAVGADGVHLGEYDLPLIEARSRLGPAAIIGVSCADSLDRMRDASEGGADYVAFGAFFPSRTKPGARRASLDRLREARVQTSLPICAIGGLTPANAGLVIEAGADLVAAVEGVFGGDDVAASARAYARLFA